MAKSDGKGKKGKGPDKGPPKKKVKVIKPRKREKWTCEQKMFVCELKKERKEPKEIIELFKKKYGVKVKASTLATWYNKKNMATYEQRATKNTSQWRNPWVLRVGSRTGEGFTAVYRGGCLITRINYLF